MVQQPSIAIIIPALNEAKTIATVVASAKAFGLPIVVDDGSRDDTGSIARANGANVVVHEVNRGYDGAIDSGFKRAAELGCSYAVTMDADGQHNPGLLRTFIEQFEQGYDIVIGVRDRRQRIAEHIFALVTQAFWKVADPLCGMKGYRMTVYHRLGHFDSFDSIGTELALFAVRNDFRLSQIPVSTRDRDGSPRFGRALSANLRILRAMFLVLRRTRKLPMNG